MLRPGACMVEGGACLLPTELNWGCSLIPVHGCEAGPFLRSSTWGMSPFWQQQQLNSAGRDLAGVKGRRIRELTSVVQKRFKFPEGSVELYAEKVANRGLCAIAQAESLRYKLLGGLAVRRCAARHEWQHTQCQLS